MASLNLDDFSSKFQSNVFRATVTGEFLKTLALFGSGFLAEAPDDIINSGRFGSMPKWNVDTTDPSEITTSSDLVPGENSLYNDTFAWQELEKSWSFQELVKTVAGTSNDAIEEIAKHIGQYWANTFQKRAIYVLRGIFASALASSHSTGNTYAAATITNAGVIAAKLKLGDFMNKLSLMIMNSKVYADALTGNLITFPAGPVGNESFRTGTPGQILGLTPYADDDLAAVSTVYSNIIGGPRSMVYKTRPREKSAMNAGFFTRTSNNIDIELSRNAALAGGTDIITTRASTMIHCPGVAWDITVLTHSLSDLATGANWTKVAQNKEIKVAELKTA